MCAHCITVVSHNIQRIFPHDSHSLPISHRITVLVVFQQHSPQYSHSIPMIFPQCSYNIASMLPQFSRDIPMVFPQHSNSIPMMFPQCFHMIPIAFLQYSHYIPRYFHAIPAAFSKHSHGIPIILPEWPKVGYLRPRDEMPIAGPYSSKPSDSPICIEYDIFFFRMLPPALRMHHKKVDFQKFSEWAILQSISNYYRSK